MKRFYFCLLALVLFTGQISAQDYKTETIGGKIVHCIKMGSSSHSYDASGNSVKMRFTAGQDYGYMKFVIKDGKAWVYSGTEELNTENMNAPAGNSHFAITNLNYKGKIYIPSYISTTGSTKYPVVGIQSFAFHQLAIKDSIILECKHLENIGSDAFSVLAKDDSYEYVVINTDKNLTIYPRAFKNLLFIKNQYEPGIDRQTCLDKKYIKYNRDCLKDVSITSKGDITIEQEAFIYCESLEKAKIISNGYVDIGSGAFACSFVEEIIDATKKPVVCHPLDRMWKRTTDLDSIRIEGKVKNIGDLAFCGHVNIKRVAIEDPRTTAESGTNIKIGRQAFFNMFHGRCDSITDVNEKEKWGIRIDGPIESIDKQAFGQTHYSDGEGDLAPDIPGYGAFYPDDITPNPASIPFEDCLNKVDITNTGNAAMTIDARAFSDRFVKTDYNSYPGSFKISGKISKIESRAACINNYTYKESNRRSRLRTIEINNSNDTMNIGDFAFLYHMTSDAPADAGSITIHNVKEIGDSAFCQNEKAMTINITNNHSNGEDLRIKTGAFQRNFQHAAYNGTLTINGKLNSIGREAFANGYGLKTVEVENNSGSTPMTIAYKAFYESMGYDEANPTQPHFTDGSLTLTGPLKSIDTQAFSKMTGLKTFDLTSDSRFSIKDRAFENDITLSEMKYKYNSESETKHETLPDSVTKVGQLAFANTGFEKITIPELKLTWAEGGIELVTKKTVKVTDDNGVKDYPESDKTHDVYNINNLLESEVFYGCTKLDSVFIDNTATGQATFDGCSQLSYVKFGPNVKYIESGVFANTPKLLYLEIPENVEAIGAAIHASSKVTVTGNYRIRFLAKQPPLAHINAFATRGSSSSNFSRWEAYVVVPWGCVSSYLFCSDDLGFQNVEDDLIACEYDLKKYWGTLGMQEHTNIKEYKGEFTKKADGSYSHSEPKLISLDKTTVRGDFTDVYDFRRVGIGADDGVSTIAKSVGNDEGRETMRDEMIQNIEKKIKTIKHTQTGLTAHVFGINAWDGKWYDEDLGCARLGWIFQFYKDIDSDEPVDQWNSTIDDYFLDCNITRNDFKEKCETLWDELKLSLDRQMHGMELNDFLDYVNLPSIIYGSDNFTYTTSHKGIRNFIEVFYGAPTLKLLELLQKDEYYEFFVVKFLSNLFYDDYYYYYSAYGNVIPNATIDEMDANCNLLNCTADDKAPIQNLYNLYSEYTQAVQTAINDYYSAFDDHIDWETDRDYFKYLHEPIQIYVADTYYKSTDKVGVDKLTKGPIIPNVTTDPTNPDYRSWNFGYLMKAKPNVYYLFHYVGEPKSADENMKRELRDYSVETYKNLKDSAVSVFKKAKTHCPVTWWDNENVVLDGNDPGGIYYYDVYPNLLVAACNASDIKSGHYLYGLSPETDVIDFIFNYKLYKKEDNISTQCRFYLLSDGRFKRFRKWTQLSEGKCFLALPTQTMWGYPDDPHVDNPSSGSNDAQSAFFIYNNDYHFIGDFNPITTDIDTIGYKDEEDGKNIRNGYWYNLDGTRLATPPTKKGIYIHNGKKIVVN